MSFIFFAWIASFAYGAETIIGKLTSKHAIDNPWLFNFLWSGFILLFTVPLALYYGAGFPQEWGSILIVSLFYALSNIFFMLAIKRLDVTVIVPLYNLKTAFTVILAIPLLGEVLNTTQYILIGIMFLAGIFVNIDEKRSFRMFFRKAIGLGLIAVLSATFWGISLTFAQRTNGFWEVALWVPVIAQIIFFGTVPFFKQEIKSVSQKQLFPVILMAITAVVGILFSNKAYETNATITSVILAIPLSMFIAFGFSVFAPKLLEKHTITVYAIRFIGVTIMIVCGLILSSSISV